MKILWKFFLMCENYFYLNTLLCRKQTTLVMFNNKDEKRSPLRLKRSLAYTTVWVDGKAEVELCISDQIGVLDMSQWCVQGDWTHVSRQAVFVGGLTIWMSQHSRLSLSPDLLPLYGRGCLAVRERWPFADCRTPPPVQGFVIHRRNCLKLKHWNISGRFLMHTKLKNWHRKKAINFKNWSSV